MASTGYIQVNAYTSNARIPLKDVSIAITDVSGSAIALRLTNKSGQLDEPVSIQVPDLSASTSPETGVVPFTSVNLQARVEGFELIEIEHLQVFPNTVTEQNLELIPLSELPDDPNIGEVFDTPPQNL